MKNILLYLSIFGCAVILNAQEPLKISDFEILNNTSWEGQLTYKDYQSGKLSTIDATMQMKIKNDRIITNIQYTYEPNKNNSSSVKLKKDGAYYGNEKVISNSKIDDERIFVTYYEGKDNGRKADIFITHKFDDDNLKIVKEVQYKNDENRFVRNTYQFTKKQ
ncbi:hypothetical protein [Winogradskyella vincentii]|uniref:DUF3836 domain-containing protein n=1 Tax=Winogradskyella vincentii TaxID=2877122 RepID=A0ABS7Y504_9FLAO|nr:hypothetical protein [Winogradskyella vincentii]MCA0153912.1 hypothetical protein [Winogradskyella vincentii]